MAQAVQNRELAKAGWRMPRLAIRIDPRIAGVILAMTAWLLQAYTSSWLAARDRLARSIQMAETQRQMWLIEYNSSLIRTPRNSRVTARAAYEVVRNTYEVLALSDLAAAGPLTRWGPILESAQEKQDWARELFDARDHAALVAELGAVSEQYEARAKERTVGVPPEKLAMPWWQHAFPCLFLIGMGLCLKGRKLMSRE